MLLRSSEGPRAPGIEACIVQGKMSLVNLPAELFQPILVLACNIQKLDDGLQMRLVCRERLPPPSTSR